MPRFASTHLVVISVLLLIPLGFTAQVACCAGISEMPDMAHHSDAPDPDCCADSLDDALAQRCCEGGDKLDRSRSASGTPIALAVLHAIPTLGNPVPIAPRWSPAPTPSPPDPLDLASSLLI